MSQARGKAALIHKEENIEHGIKADCVFCGACLVAQMVKNLPAMPETWVQSLGWEDLEEGMATHSNILAWEIPMDRGAWPATVHAVAKRQTQLKQLTHQKHF